MNSKDQQELLRMVPNDGRAVGNKSLREVLNWDEAKYWRVRDSLINDGVLVLGRGKGGAVRLSSSQIADVPVVSGKNDVCELDHSEPELNWYSKIEKVLNERWAKDLQLDEFFIQQTAKAGKKETGGKWSRPDLVAVSVSVYRNIPGKFVDVHTFEVKKSEGCDVASVYEALAHRRAANKSSLIVIIPRINNDELDSMMDRVAEEAARHGIGLIATDDPSDYDTWDFRIEAVSTPADIALIDEFIETQIKDENKKKLHKWIK